MTKEYRNSQVVHHMEQLLSAAKSNKFVINTDTQSKIREIANSTARGFREIILTICIGRLLEPSYDPTSELYACHPRAIYEGPIRSAIRGERIPHGKSGPLNIAKATQGLTEEWAAQRGGGNVAYLVVDIANDIAIASEDQVKNIATAMLAEMLSEAALIVEYKVEIPEEIRLGNLNALIFDMIERATDGGNTAQKIVGYALEAHHEVIRSGVIVEGHTDSASTTNVTSKKPGDLVEMTDEGIAQSVIEVTTKPFFQQRIEESVDAVRVFSEEYNQEIREVIVLCRPIDVPSESKPFTQTSSHMGSIDFEGISFEFINLFEWLSSLLSRLGTQGRQRFYTTFDDYVNEPNTSQNVKATWAVLHKNMLM